MSLIDELREMRSAYPSLRELLDQADGALDKDTYEQFRREELDLPDDAEVWITAGTRRKINRLFEALDKHLRTQA